MSNQVDGKARQEKNAYYSMSAGRAKCQSAYPTNNFRSVAALSSYACEQAQHDLSSAQMTFHVVKGS